MELVFTLFMMTFLSVYAIRIFYNMGYDNGYAEAYEVMTKYEEGFK